MLFNKATKAAVRDAAVKIVRDMLRMMIFRQKDAQIVFRMS